jgi:type VI secretion system secreted protein VgrG
MATAPGVWAANRTSYQFRLDQDTDGPTFSVLRFDGDEGLSRLFRFRVRLGVALDEVGDGVDTEDYLGRTAFLRIDGPAGTRYVDGYIRRFEYAGAGRTLAYYRAELVPLHWMLTKRFGSRVFTEDRVTNLGVRQLIQKVFGDYAGLPDDSYDLQCTDYPRGDFVAQYQESEWNFVSRIMEDVGIFYFFEHNGQGPAVMKIADDSSAHPTSTLHPELSFLPVTEAGERDEFVYELRDLRRVRTGAAVVEGYDFTRGPQYDTQAQRQADRFTNLERYEYPRRLEYDGPQTAQLRLDTEQCRKWVVRMKTTAHGLVAGHRFRLTDHPNQVYNREYTVVRVRQRGVHPQQSEHDDQPLGRTEAYSATIWAIPADTRFIPRRRARRPRIHGTQTAVVVGPESEKIYTDEYGRVRVQFHWDREGSFDTDGSHWIRVSQGMAGGRHGMQFLPRVGHEVIVEFLEGDPDQPIITGRVYNGDHRPPYDLPDEKTKSTIKTHTYPDGGGCNELRFEDQDDHEQILLHAEKDLHVKAKGTACHSTGGSRNISTGGDHKEHVGGARHLEVSQDENVRIGGDQHVQAANFYFNTDGEYGVLAERRVDLTTAVLEAQCSERITLKGPGGGFIQIDGSGVTIQGTRVWVNCSSPVPQLMTGVMVANPAGPAGADSSTPGSDIDYRQGSQGSTTTESRTADSNSAGEASESPTREIRMRDDQGRPAAGERYRIERPNDTPIQGRLDRNGTARVRARDAEDSRITFPDLDQSRWRSTASAGSDPSQGMPRF